MEVIIENCCGIDVHKKTIVACLMKGKPHEKPKTTIKTFTTMSRDILACREWLKSEGCTHVALERPGSTGNRSLIFWKRAWKLSSLMPEILKMFLDARPT